MPTALKIRKGDTVKVMVGKDRGKQGKVQRLRTKDHRSFVEGVNMVKKHQKQQGVARQAGIISMEAPLELSNVVLICPRCNKSTRVGFKFLEDKRKVRACHKCHETIDA